MQHIIREGLRLQPPFSSQNLPGIKSEDTNRAGNCVSGVEEGVLSCSTFWEAVREGEDWGGAAPDQTGKSCLGHGGNWTAQSHPAAWVN